MMAKPERRRVPLALPGAKLPSYTSAQAACSRYFLLVEGLSVAGSHPMDPDEVIKGTRTSMDSETMLEMLDLGAALHRAGVVESSKEWHLLWIEYTRPDLPIAGPAGGRNKLALLRSLCPEVRGMREGEYLAQLTEIMVWVRNELEARRWIPKRQASSRQTPPSLRNR